VTDRRGASGTDEVGSGGNHSGHNDRGARVGPPGRHPSLQPRSSTRYRRRRRRRLDAPTLELGHSFSSVISLSYSFDIGAANHHNSYHLCRRHHHQQQQQQNRSNDYNIKIIIVTNL